MTFTVSHHADATEFVAAAEPFLMEHEALHSMILGVARTQQRQVLPRRRSSPLFLTVGSPTGPALAALMSSSRKFLLAAGTPPPDDALATLVSHLFNASVNLPGVFGEEMLVGRFAGLWAAAAGCQPTPTLRQRLHKLTTALLLPEPPLGQLRPATVRESDLLAHWALDFQLEALPQEAGDLDSAQIMVDGLLGRKDLYVWEAVDGDQTRVVSMAARARPTQRGIAINLVYTPPAERRRGYATALVAHLSRLLLDAGWQFCTLFTDRANATANGLYARIGYHPIADFAEYRFDPPAAFAGKYSPPGRLA